MKKVKEPDQKYKYTENAKTAERISELIGDNSITTVANDLEVSRQTISNFINGRYKPDVDNLEKMADYFNVSTDYILGRTDVKSSNTTIIDMKKHLGLSEQAIEYLHYLDDNTTELLDHMLCKTISDNPLMEQEYSLFTRLLNRGIDYIENATEYEINRNNTIKPADMAHIYGSDFGIEYEKEQVELKLKAKGHGIYKTETILETQLIEIERLFSQIIKSIVNDLVEEQKAKE